MKGEIKNHDNNPMFSIEVEGLTYQMSLMDVPIEKHDWFVSVLSRHITDIHSRTRTNAWKEFTDNAKKVFGL